MVFGRLLKRTTALAMAAVMTFSMTGCAFIGKANNPNEKEQTEFNEFCDELFVEMLGDDALSIHYTLADPEKYGIKIEDYTLGDLTLDSIKEDEERIDEIVRRLGEFDSELLTKRQQLTLKTLIDYWGKQQEFNGYAMLTNLFGTNSGIVANLSVNFIEYVFDDEEDVKVYLDLLKDTRRYIGQLLDFTRLQSENGTFMASFCAQENIDNCKKYLENEVNPMIASFDEKLDALEGISDDKKAGYKATNKEYIEKYFDTAYQDIIDTLTELKQGKTNDLGLCNLEGGKEYYTAIVHDKTSTNMSPEKVIRLLDKELSNLLSEFSMLYYGDENLPKEMMELDPGMSDIDEILTFLADKCSSEFPDPVTKEFVVQYQSKATEIEGTLAYYLKARLDRLDYNSIKVNGSGVTDDVTLYTTLAHEGFPGHLYQFTSVYGNEEIPNVMKLVDFIGYTEGYAEYASDRSYTFLGCSEALTRLMVLNDMFGYILQSRVDLGVNYEGWTIKDVSNYLADYISEPSAASAIYEAVVSDPGLLLPYTIGHIKMNSFRIKAENSLEDKFDAKEYHAAILDAGIVSLDIMEEIVNNYIDQKKSSN